MLGPGLAAGADRAQDPRPRQGARPAPALAGEEVPRPFEMPGPPRRPAEDPPLTEELAREIAAEDFTRLFTPAPPAWQPRTGWAYTAYGTSAFVPLAGWVGAGLAAGGGRPFWASGVNALAAGALGFLPASLGGLYSNPVRGRWRDVDVTVFGLSLLLTPPLAGLGAWSSQSLFFGGHAEPGRAWLAASLGALVGHLVGMGLDTLLRERFPLPELGGYRLLLSISCVGSGAALGQALFSRPAR